MPMNRGDYPPDWEEIARRVKEAANWTCEACGQVCRREGETLRGFLGRIVAEAEGDAEGLIGHCLAEILDEIEAHPQRYTLTVHHPNHDKSDPAAVLIALCAPCHLRADHEHHVAKARQSRLRKRGQLTLSVPMGATEAPA